MSRKHNEFEDEVSDIRKRYKEKGHEVEVNIR